jgi:hypothetical protein
VEAAEAPAEGLARSLQGVEVFDLSGKAVPVVDLWKGRKAVVAFARHFGSIRHFCPNYLLSFMYLMILTVSVLVHCSCVLCRKRADLLAAKQVGCQIPQSSKF